MRHLGARTPQQTCPRRFSIPLLYDDQAGDTPYDGTRHACACARWDQDETMTRKDTADLDRPHYYSQFWVDIAAGKRDVTATSAAEADLTDLVDLDTDMLAEEELPPPPPAPVVKPAAKAKPAKPAPEPPRSTITSLADLDQLMKSSAEMDDDTVPDIEASEIGDLAPFGQPAQDEGPAIVTDFDLDQAAEEPVAEAADEDEDMDFDEEEEDEWGAPRRGSKPQKPPRKREPRERRSF